MKTMLHSFNIAPTLVRLKNAAASRPDGGVWTIEAGIIRALPCVAAHNLVLVPAEDVLTITVALPLPSHARRLAALPFAIEDRIADRIDGVHLALSTQSIGGSWLASVVDPERMRSWLLAAAEAGLGDAALMPDALALPLPADGRWNVLRADGGRILVRTSDGTGFAAEQSLFLPIWTAAGKPECNELAAHDMAIPIILDLRQGEFARPRQRLSASARRVAIVAAGGLLAHGAIAAADTIALRSIADSRGAELIRVLDTVAPGRFTATDPHEAAMLAAELLPAGVSGPPGTLLPVLGRASTALAPFGNLLVTRSLEYDEAKGQLLLDVDLSDPAASSNILIALRNAGLSARFRGNRLIIGGGDAA